MRRTQWLSVISAIFLALVDHSALAYLLTYTQATADQPASFAGSVPLAKIAGVLLPKGMASLEGDQMKIRAVPRWLFDRNLVLQGAIIRAEVVVQQSSCVLGGLVYFHEGQWLDALDKGNTIDWIDTISGAHLRGRVFACTEQTLQLRKKDGSIEKIAFANIKAIKSPRAFAFNLTSLTNKPDADAKTFSFDVGQIVFKQTEARYALLAKRHSSLPKSNLSGTELGISKASLAYFAAFDIMSIIAPAIVIPLVINKRNQAAGQAEINKALAASGGAQ